MSHWTVCKLKIKNPDIQLLRQALEIIAKELNSEIAENFLVRGYRASRKCIYAIPLSLPYGNGYGIYLQNGEIRVVVDDHGAPLRASEFAAKLQQYYVSLAISQVASQMGFQVSNVQETEQGVLIDLAR